MKPGGWEAGWAGKLQTDLVALVHDQLNVGKRAHGHLGKVLDVRAKHRMFAHAQVVPGLGIQQIADTLVVDLHVAMGGTLEERVGLLESGWARTGR